MEKFIEVKRYDGRRWFLNIKSFLYVIDYGIDKIEIHLVGGTNFIINENYDLFINKIKTNINYEKLD